MAKKAKKSAYKYARAARKAGTKLDPLLSFGAERVKLEKGGLAALAQSPAPSLSELPVGCQSLAAQMPIAHLERFEREDTVSVLVDTSDPDYVVEKAKSWKTKARALTSSKVALTVPRSQLARFAKLKRVRYVESSVKLRPHCDIAHLSTSLIRNNVRTVTQRGQGVLVGVVDTGIDVNHAAFQANGATRIVDYLDQNTGDRFDAADIDAGLAAGSKDLIGHGTHVAGIAAGNGAGSPGAEFAGVAPEADLAIVKTTFSSVDILEAIRHIFDVADQRDQPCVVNLSLGGHVGGHDGSTATERTIDELSGPGRLVVASAGNEADDGLHASVTLPQGQTTEAEWDATFRLTSRQLSPTFEGGFLRVQVWRQHEDDLTVQLEAPNGQVFTAPSDSSQVTNLGNILVRAENAQAAYSNDQVDTFTIVTEAEPEHTNGWRIRVTEDRSGGRTGVSVGSVHAWIADRDMGAFTAGATVSHLIGMPGTSFSAITVASYATKNSWSSIDPLNPNITLNGITIEEISNFSSPGPTRDGHNKPEIAAPGQYLIAPLSADALLSELPIYLRQVGIPYAALQGTSMSAPYVTGALALLLESNPAIDWAEAKRRLIKSARQDAQTGPAWNPDWGYGKVDVEQLLRVEP